MLLVPRTGRIKGRPMTTWEGPSVEEIARETTIAVAFLRKLEFRAIEARDLVTRAIRTTPLRHWTADELVRAALVLVGETAPATA